MTNRNVYSVTARTIRNEVEAARGMFEASHLSGMRYLAAALANAYEAADSHFDKATWLVACGTHDAEGLAI